MGIIKDSGGKPWRIDWSGEGLCAWAYLLTAYWTSSSQEIAK